MTSWELTSNQLAVLPRCCTKCNQPLTESARMLELDPRDWTYHDRRDIPESHGWFPFCLSCASDKANHASA